MEEEFRILTNIRLKSNFKIVKEKFHAERIRAKYAEARTGTVIYVHIDDYPKAHSIVIDMRLDDVEDADLSIDDS